MTDKQAESLDQQEARMRLSHEPIASIDPLVVTVQPCSRCMRDTAFLTADMHTPGEPMCGTCLGRVRGLSEAESVRACVRRAVEVIEHLEIDPVSQLSRAVTVLQAIIQMDPWDSQLAWESADGAVSWEHALALVEAWCVGAERRES